MTRDVRRLPANERVAASHLFASYAAERYTDGDFLRIGDGVVDLYRQPGGRRDRQLLMGAPVIVYEIRRGWAFVQSERDDYVGYVPERVLTGPEPEPTHSVHVRATHVYSEPDFKSRELETLSMGARLHVISQQGRFYETYMGFVPVPHLEALSQAPSQSDPVTISERLLGTPYLWGGNSAFGIDCSGLVQMGCHGADLHCPGDSDMQERELGETLPEGSEPRRGDLLFWKGHVAWVSDPETILHANAHAMAVVYEPLKQAVKRIADQGDGPVTRHARIAR